MGKRVARKTYKLSFQPDTDLDGLVVVVRGLSIGQSLDLRAGGAGTVEGGEKPSNPVEHAARMLASQLVEWNAEDEDGVPIPATLEGVLSQDADFVTTIVAAWQEAVASVAAPLPETSTDGQPSVEASIPMEIPSESLAS